MEHLRIGAKDLADRFWIGQHHERALAVDVEREGVSVTAAALVEQPQRVAREADELPPRRGSRPAREDMRGCQGGRRR